MSPLVVDASVAVKWVVEEEGSPEAAALRGDELYAPDWIHVDCANVLWAKARRQQLTEEEAARRLALLLDAPLLLTPSRGLLEQALAMALELAHPVYDCLYLALALASVSTLVTADRGFVAAVRQSGLYDARVRWLFEPSGGDPVMEG